MAELEEKIKRTKEASRLAWGGLAFYFQIEEEVPRARQVFAFN
jgi:hypothetical protein